ncbi:helix-turn-helix domain-containing protein, partial [Bifidobacterium breve]|nr:helix-turn-helix domain-containing protein [Bifidobacterium breve]
QAETYYPDDKERAQNVNIMKAFEDIASQEDFPIVYLKLPGYEELPLTGELARVLLQVTQQLSNNKAIFVAPLEMKLTTQEAADMLSMSRPTLVKLLE